ncbi:unnamed protein product [Rotaria sp. Silwood1]|nr:unnamed protein product [Rotaria sp. Silwood1]
MFNVPIAIWINDYMYMQVNSDHDGRFSGSFQIGSNLFGGQLHIAAAHPIVTSSPQSQDVIFIEYLKLSLSKWSYQFYAAYVTNFTDFATIQNQGDFDLINITVDIIQDTICVENYSAWPTIIPVLPAFSNMTISLSMLLNCTLSAQYMNFSISESRIPLLTSAGFIIDSQWSCRTQNGCSNHGSCINNETCFCADSYSGYSCEQCIPDRYAYPSCIICPTCVRGQTICNSSVAICDCIDNTRIYGTLCQYCREGYYGDNCTNMPVLSSLFPRSSSELTNETLVTLVGDNFNNVSLFCLIIDQNDTISIPAVYINTGKITCQFPSHRAELIEVQLIMNESIVFSESKLVFQYLSSCPDTGCNQGLCISNTCQCWYPHFGSDCSLYPIPPVLTTIHNMTAIEMSSFTFNLSQYLTQGEFPLEWSLSGTIPSGLSITPYSGLLSWSSAVALSTIPVAVLPLFDASSSNCNSTVASYLTSGIGGGAESGGTASWGSSVPAGGGGTGSFGFGSSGDFSEMLQILGTTIDPVIAPLLPVPTCESCVGTLASAAADLLIQRLPIGWRVVLNVIDKCVANTVTETNTTAQIPDTSSTETSTITITTNSLLQSTPTTAINASSQSTTKSVTDTSFQFNTTSTTDSSSESSTTATAHESSQLTTTTTTDVSSESTTTISTDKSSQPMTTTTADLSSELTITPTIDTSFQSTTTTNIDLSSASRIRTTTDESSQPMTTTTIHLSSESTTTISTDESSQPMTTTTPDLSSPLTITPTIDTSFQSTATANIDLSSASRTTITTDESSQPTPTPTIEASSQPITTSITEIEEWS